MDLTDLNEAPLVAAALEYASRGWPVHPLKPRAKQPLLKHGLLDASTDPETVQAWWRKWPDANIGLRTGVAFDVLDVDGDLGRAAMVAMAPGYKHPGPVGKTGKGFHLLFHVSGARNTAAKVPGLDFRGQNGYIAAAPSIHPLGHAYQWARDGELPEPTDWLHWVLKPKRTTEPRKDFDPTQLNPIVPLFALYYGQTMEQSGATYRTNCPWHDDSTPSFYLYPENNSFYCFGCEEWGDSLDLKDSYNAATQSADGIYPAPSELRAK